MWKKSLTRGAVSYSICVTATVIASLITSLYGAKYTCTPDFIARVGSENVANFLQPLLIGLIGFAFGAGSVLFEIEHWSFLKQGSLHLTLTAAVWIIVELICFTPFTPPAVLSFALSSIATYGITWGAQYFVWRAQVKKLDAQIRSRNEENK